MYVNLAKLISMLKLAKTQRTNSFIISNYKNFCLILNKFIEIGVIRGFTLNLDGKIEVFLKYNNNKVTFNNIMLVRKPSRKTNISYIKLMKVTSFYNTSVFLLSTYDGFKFNYECINKKIGGELLIKIDF